ncbi:hypothetical protein B0E46_05085 [Rhodanobacter sp. B04]|nr:hypothetical protein B0E46_05085 [Rhodanobacter sp. B04]
MHDAVVAYCQYRFQAVPSFARVQQLIHAGKAAEVDRLFSGLLQAQLTRPTARGRLDRAFYQDFNNGSAAIRPTLDAWKRSSPSSAFAYAASGYAYVAMAGYERGNGYIENTPQGSVKAMDQRLQQADTDLRHAIALDPRLTPVYSAMIKAGGLSLGRDYALDAARRGLAVAPDNSSIHDMLMWVDQPKWGGSLLAMQQVTTEAQTHAAENPLLRLLLSDVMVYEASNCECEKSVELAAYPVAFDHMGSSGNMLLAGNAAHGSNQELEAVYLSEALRFDPAIEDARVNRIYDLIEFDELAWAITEATRLLKRSSHNMYAWKVRAEAYEAMNDAPHAEADLRAALEVDPVDMPTLVELGNLYVNVTHEWSNGWAIADELIKQHPHNPYGWLLRAHIQERQPRAGLRDTVAYFDANFSNAPSLQKDVDEMRAVLDRQSRSDGEIPLVEPVAHR